MKSVENRGNIGIVMHTDDQPAKIRERATSAHLVLNRYKIDEDGRICITQDLPMTALRGEIELLKAQLDGLVEDAQRHLALS